ncbi:phosphoprotein 3 (GPP34) [Idiomarina sp. A28L]|uniref:GOLPH3/VPS74 family protein n=1 Tax=Idiomarina sp. A28L TaxID=1036674 RepID=UPI00021386C9|nr:GPP34 family phosphoprotein [Idiomarina sp. A28L]EGN75626.1 phosphoprotein 3 (GPP34) [Idiomarina sp. A28L]
MGNLRIYEELILLALCEEKGTMGTSFLQYAVSGALLSELMFMKRLQIEENKKKLVNIVDASPTGDALLDECLEKIASAKRRANMKAWVQRLASIKDLRHKVAHSLVQHRIVEASEDKILWLFTRKVYPEVNPIPEKEIRNRMRNAVLSAEAKVDPRTTVLIALAKSAALLPQVFSKEELKQYKKRIEQIVAGDLMGDVTKEVIAACQAAVMVAVMIPAITVATT